jgi:hypothetical protein
VATSGIDSTIKVGLMDLIFVHLLLFGFLILQHGSRSGLQVLQFHQLWLGEQPDQKFLMCWKPWKATNEGYAIIVKLSCKTTSPWLSTEFTYYSVNCVLPPLEVH